MNLNIDLLKLEESSNISIFEDNELQSIYNSNADSADSDNADNVGEKNLALNLEAIASIEESEELLSSYEIPENEIANIIASIGAGYATESVINARIIDKIENSGYQDENTGEYVLNESRAMVKTVVRHGKLAQKTVCPSGFRVSNGVCVRMTSKDMIAFTRRAKKAAKTRLRRSGSTGLRAMKSRNRSLLVRNKNQGRVNRVVSAPAPSSQFK